MLIIHSVLLPERSSLQDMPSMQDLPLRRLFKVSPEVRQTKVCLPERFAPSVCLFQQLSLSRHPKTVFSSVSSSVR